jgi:hypothetical protein
MVLYNAQRLLSAPCEAGKGETMRLFVFNTDNSVGILWPESPARAEGLGFFIG